MFETALHFLKKIWSIAKFSKINKKNLRLIDKMLKIEIICIYWIRIILFIVSNYNNYPTKHVMWY